MDPKNFSHTGALIFRKTLLFLSGILITLALLEAGLRVGGFILSSVQEYENVRSAKQKGAYRILCLGESTTERKYPHLLEEILNRRNIGVRFSVIDKGKSTANTDFLLSRVDSYLNEYHPDMVVAMMGNNDTLVQYYRDIPETDSWIFHHCRVYRFGRMLVMHILKKIRHQEIYGLSARDSGTISQTMKAGNVSAKKMALENGPMSGDESLLKKAILLDPGNDQAYVELGRLYRLGEKFSESEDFLKKALKLNPRNNNAYAELGWLYFAQGGLPKAEDFYKKAIASDPNNDSAYALLGRLYREQGEFLKAEDLCKTALQINPRNIIAAFQLAWLYRKQGKLADAKDTLNNVAALNPSNGRLLAAMASLYDEMGEPELAKAYLAKAHQGELGHNAAVTVKNYRRLKEILDRKKIKLVCVQYPMLNVAPLKSIFANNEGVIFIDNEQTFKDAIRRSGYKEYFKDMFAGDFGHCTRKGNLLLAQNIADGILRNVFHRS